MYIKHMIPVADSKSIVFHYHNYTIGEYVFYSKIHTRDDINKIVFCVKGNYNIVVENKVISSRYGNIITFIKDELRGGVFCGDNAYEMFQLDIPVGFMSELPEYRDIVNDCFINRENGDNNINIPAPEEIKNIHKLLYRINDIIASGNKESDYEAYVCVLQIMYYVNYSFNRQDGSSDYSALYPSKILNVTLALINSDFSSLKSLNDILRRVNISKSYLQKLFSKYIGCSPYQYLIDIKMINAKKLLTEGVPVTEACIKSGFADYSRFISSFKKRFGMTPMKYKMMFAGNRK